MALRPVGGAEPLVGMAATTSPRRFPAHRHATTSRTAAPALRSRKPRAARVA